MENLKVNRMKGTKHRLLKRSLNVSGSALVLVLAKANGEEAERFKTCGVRTQRQSISRHKQAIPLTGFEKDQKFHTLP